MLTEKTRITSTNDVTKIPNLPSYEKIYKRLFEYEENAENGTMLLPPCSIGNIVYTCAPEGIILGKIISFQINVSSDGTEYLPRAIFYLKSPFSSKYECFEFECTFKKDDSRKTLVFTSYEEAVEHFHRGLDFDTFRHQFCSRCTFHRGLDFDTFKHQFCSRYTSPKICMYDCYSNVVCANKKRKE